ncbi:MAG: DUF664 domain-containing protein [Sulfitobacter sp.]|nr:DUF664 domain-containing protein [Sulfitobacter sp.]
MIQSGYVRTMVRYNAWQNRQVAESLSGLDASALTKDRGAFFGSILGTLNHLLWGDQMWMSRWCLEVEKPTQEITETTEVCATAAEWWAARATLDGRMRDWAEGLDDADLEGDLSWYSGATGKDQSQPMWLCVTHMFNHQTHHRGQVHAMLTAAGQSAPVSDLVFMSEDA